MQSRDLAARAARRKPGLRGSATRMNTGWSGPELLASAKRPRPRTARSAEPGPYSRSGSAPALRALALRPGMHVSGATREASKLLVPTSVASQSGRPRGGLRRGRLPHRTWCLNRAGHRSDLESTVGHGWRGWSQSGSLPACGRQSGRCGSRLSLQGLNRAGHRGSLRTSAPASSSLPHTHRHGREGGHPRDAPGTRRRCRGGPHRRP